MKILKALIKGSCLYGSSESTTARSDAVVANNAFASPTWLVNLKTLKNTDYPILNVLETYRQDI
jgi:hypothetical protein